MAPARSAAAVGHPVWSSTILQLRALGAKPQHGANEIRAVRAEHPRRAQDQMLRAGAAHQTLALFLAPPIDIERSDRIVLPIGRSLRPVEHIVGGDLDEGHVGRGGGLGEHRRPVAIGAQRRIDVGLGLIDGGIARGVDDRRRRVLQTACLTAAASEMSTEARSNPVAASPARRMISRPTWPLAPNTRILRCIARRPALG